LGHKRGECTNETRQVKKDLEFKQQQQQQQRQQPQQQQQRQQQQPANKSSVLAFLAGGAESQRAAQEQLERLARLNAVQFQEMDEQAPTGRVPSLQTPSSTPKGGSHSRCENRQTGLQTGTGWCE
jgi:hypothetical protein